MTDPIDEIFGKQTEIDFGGDPLGELEQLALSKQQTPSKTMPQILKKLITPLVSGETIQTKFPISAAIGSMIPIYRMTSGEQPYRIPSPNLLREGATALSEETSPASILKNIGVGVGALGKMKKLPIIFSKDYTLEQAQRTSKELGRMRTFFGKAKESAINKVPNIVVNTNEVPLNNLPKVVMNALDDPLYNIERTSNGVIRPTIANLDRVKGALGDFMTTKLWNEASNKSQQVIKKVYGSLNDAMKTAAKDAGFPIDKALDDYHNFMTKYSRIIRTVEDVGGEVVEQPLRRTFRPLAERGKVKAFQGLAEQSPEIAQVIKNMQKYTGRQMTKGALGGLGGLGLFGYLIHNAIARGLLGRGR